MELSPCPERVSWLEQWIMANLCFSAFTADGTSHGDDQKGQFSLDASTDSQLVVVALLPTVLEQSHVSNGHTNISAASSGSSAAQRHVQVGLIISRYPFQSLWFCETWCGSRALRMAREVRGFNCL